MSSSISLSVHAFPSAHCPRVGVLSPCALLTGIQGSGSMKPLPTRVPLKSYTPSPPSMIITGITSQHILNHAGVVLGTQVRSQWTADLHTLPTSFISEQQFVLFLPPKVSFRTHHSQHSIAEMTEFQRAGLWCESSPKAHLKHSN